MSSTKVVDENRAVSRLILRLGVAVEPYSNQLLHALRRPNNLQLVLLGRDLYRSPSNLPDQPINVSLVVFYCNLKEQVHATGCAEGTAGKPSVSSSIVSYSRYKNRQNRIVPDRALSRRFEFQDFSRALTKTPLPWT